jgi:hypothetical protein
VAQYDEIDATFFRSLSWGGEGDDTAYGTRQTELDPLAIVAYGLFYSPEMFPPLFDGSEELTNNGVSDVYAMAVPSDFDW